MKRLIAAAVLASAFATPAMAGELAGLYAGGNLGLGAPSMTTEDSDCWYECSAYTNRPTGLTYGIKVGQNLVSGGFLYGWDLDYDAGSISESYQYAYFSNPPDQYMKVTSEFKSVASLKAKAGLMIQDTALTLSFGLARGKFEGEFRDRNGNATPADDDHAVSDGSQNGFVYGAGVQHAFGDKLILSADIQKFSFKTDTQYMKDLSGAVQNNYHLRFVNDLDQFRVSLAYRFM